MSPRNEMCQASYDGPQTREAILYASEKILYENYRTYYKKQLENWGKKASEKTIVKEIKSDVSSLFFSNEDNLDDLNDFNGWSDIYLIFMGKLSIQYPDTVFTFTIISCYEEHDEVQIITKEVFKNGKKYAISDEQQEWLSFLEEELGKEKIVQLKKKFNDNFTFENIDLSHHEKQDKKNMSYEEILDKILSDETKKKKKLMEENEKHIKLVSQCKDPNLTFNWE
ncbi:MAG: hypothetical protein Edafosvirus9_3 [Edafosvirus sp.]|uniref:Uncharacterized protein n=1 Tax=Edafosvirus sp. TaxID=2487765 RepID=A0A3G4ZY12_9VIRU|nr:MAG: hypothetical protein Edafosvirus9_3 [Edafosvirus sp.]